MREATDYVAGVFRSLVSDNVKSDDVKRTFEMTVFYPNDTMGYSAALKALRHPALQDVILSYDSTGVVPGVRIRVHLNSADDELSNARMQATKARETREFTPPPLDDPHTGRSLLTDADKTWVKSASATLHHILPTIVETMRVEKSKDVRGLERVRLRCDLKGEVPMRDVKRAYETMTGVENMTIRAGEDDALEVTVSTLTRKRQRDE